MMKMQYYENTQEGDLSQSYRVRKEVVRKDNKEQQPSTFSWGNAERQNIQLDSVQTIYKKRTLVHNLLQPAQAAKQ